MRALLAAAFAVLYVSPAAALDASGLTGEVEALLQRMRTAAAPAQLLWNPIETVPEGDALRLRLSGLRVDGIEGASDLEIGTVDLRVREIGPGLFVVDDVHLPPRAVVRQDGIDGGSLAVEVERFSATYSAALGVVTQLDVALRQIVLRPGNDGVFVADRVAALVETLPEVNAYGATGLEVQRLEASIAGLSATATGKALGLDSFAVEANLHGFDWLALRRLWTIFRDQQVAVLLGDQTLLSALRKAWIEADPAVRSYDLAIRLDGLRVVDDREDVDFVLARLESSGVQEATDRDGFFATEGSVRAEGLGVGGAAASKVGPYLALVPHAFSSTTRSERVPASAWSAVFFDLVAVYASGDGEVALAAVLASSQAFNQALAEAGTLLLLRDLTVETPLLKLDNKASLRYATDAKLGVVGTWVATLAGLDSTLLWSEGLPDEEARRSASAIVLGLRGFGQAATQADGTAVHRFNIVYAPDGAVTVNGLPLDTLFQNADPR